MKNSYKMKL